MTTDTHPRHPRQPKSGLNWVAIGLIAIIGYFLIMEHWAHILPWLPYTLLLGCVVMHLFMHGSHGDGHKSNGDDNTGKGEGP